jgi:mannosyltransferase OCH1-like enzyme
MSRWQVLGISLIALSTFLLAYRNYLRDLAEVVLTFTTFRKLDLDLFYPDPADLYKTEEAEHLHLTPRITHQIYLHENHNSSLDKYREPMTSCRTLHTGRG